MTAEHAAEITAAFETAGSSRGAAIALNMPRTTFRRKLAEARGFEHTPDGFRTAGIATTLDAHGEPRSYSVKAKSGEQSRKHEVPEGMALSRLSALVDAQGRVIQEWRIATREGESAEAVIEAFRASCAGIERLAPVAAPDFTDDELLTLYPIADQHHGLYAWAAEAGDDYDLAESERLLKAQLSRLVALAPPSRRAVVLGLGDFFHTDGHDAVTVASRNQLDRDGRQSKVVRSGIRLMRWAIDLALTKHEIVSVTIRAGNHDPMTSIHLAHMLDIAYESEPRVTVDLDPSLFWFATFGSCLIAATHGHTIKPGDFPALLATECDSVWSATEFRYGWQGHIHHETKIERSGVIVETLQTLAAKDAWHAGKGYTSGRSMIAVTYHRDLGEVSRIKSPVRRDRAKRKARVHAL